MQELVGHLDSYMHVSALIASQVNDKVLHALHIQIGKGYEHFSIGLFSEVLDTYISGLVVNHIGSIHADYRNISTLDGEI